MSDTYYRAVYFPLKGEQDVRRLILAYSPNSLVSSGVKQALLEFCIPYRPPLAYFKLENFLNYDPIHSLGQRLFDALPDNLVKRIEPDDQVSEVWLSGPDRTSPDKMHLLIMPEEAVTMHAAIASLPVNLRSRNAGAVARQTLARTVGPLTMHSTCSSDPKQLFEDVGTLAGSPFWFDSPTSIFDSRLAGLADALRDLAQAVPLPSSLKLEWALKFFTVALNSHDDEAEMEKVVRLLLNEHIGDSEWHDTIERGKPEAHGLGWIYTLKKQNGFGGDPEAQSIAYIRKKRLRYRVLSSLHI